MKIKNYLYLALCFVIGTFLGYKLAENPFGQESTLKEDFRRIENEDFSKFKTAKTDQDKIAVIQGIHEKVFSILLADIAINLDTKAWLLLLQEEKRLGTCMFETTSASVSAELIPTATLTTPKVELSEKIASSEPTVISQNIETELNDEVKNDKSPFIKDGKILRPTSFFMKTKPLDHPSKIVQKLKGLHHYRFSNSKKPSLIYRLKINSQLNFAEGQKEYSGKSEIELRDEKNRIVSMIRSSRANKYFLYNADAPEVLIILTSPTSFLQLEDQGEEGLVGHFYLQRDSDKKYYLWGSLIK